jgi:IS1 family transposase
MTLRDDHAERMAWTLGTVIHWHGKRGGEKDELLPTEDQPPAIAMAMRALDDWRAYVENTRKWKDQARKDYQADAFPSPQGDSR